MAKTKINFFIGLTPSIKAIFCASLFLALPLSTQARISGGGEGSTVGNGGGLSEQALLSASLHFKSFAASCLKYPACAQGPAVQAALQKTMACPLPQNSSFRFSIPKDTPALSGVPYAALSATDFVINREKLYTADNTPLRIPTALAYITRIFMDHCGALGFDQSSALTAPLSKFADFDSEQLTVGKDSIQLPIADWIRIRSLYSDLVIETKQGLLLLSCPGNQIRDCSLAKAFDTSEARFKNLSLASEQLVTGQVKFEVEGSLVAPNSREIFHLTGIFKDGEATQILLNGQPLDLPPKE